MTKHNQITSRYQDREFVVFKENEKSKGFISLNMVIKNPRSVSLNTFTYSIDDETEAQFGIHFNHDIETLEKLVKWTKSVTRKANRQIKKLKEQG